MTNDALEPPAEVIRLHRFFDDWFEGRSGLTIGEFADAMDPQFTIVGPDGEVLERDAIITAVREAFGKGGVRITVGEFKVFERNGYVVCRYNEVHTAPDETTTRISTVVMEPDPDTPGGYRWITVHETWAPS